jgi:hypothetical protein
MAQNTNPQGNPRADLTDQYRTIVSKAYAAVAGQQVNCTFNTITFEELAAQQIDRLTGKGPPGRPNVVQQIQNVADDLANAVQQMEQTDPSDFNLPPDESQDVNTPA